jgi:site-specific DNA recombinase
MELAPYVLYGRVSSDDQRERVTIQTQLSEIRPWCALNHIEIVAEYLDDGVSGTVPLDARPGGSRLLADLRSGRTNARGVVCLTHKRIGRKALVIHLAIEQIEVELGLSLVAVREPVPREASAGARAMMRAMYAGVAQYDREDIIANSRAGMERVARAGGWLGGRPPFGYRLVPFVSPDLTYRGKRLAIDEAQAEIVRLIFDLCERGYSQTRIADELNARNVPHPIGWHDEKRNRQWYGATAGAVLRNPLYAGEWTWRNRKRLKRARSVKRLGDGIKASVPAIIEPARFRAVQAAIDTRKRFSPRNVKRVYLCRGLVKCGACGRSFVAFFGGGRRVIAGREKIVAHPYYRCMSHVAREATRPPCGTPGVRADYIDAAAWAFCREFITNPASALAELRELLAVRQASSHIATSGERRAAAAGALARKVSRRERLVSLVADGTLSKDEARAQLDALRREIEALEVERARESARRALGRTASSRIESIARMLERLREGVESADDARKVEIVRALVESVTVLPGEKHPRLKFVFRFEPPAVVDYDETGTPNSTTRLMASGLDADAGASVKRTRSPAVCAS